MKSFAAIMDVTPDNRVAKYLDFDTEQEALDHVARFQHHDPVEYEGDGVTESFSIPWVIKSGKDVKITLRDANGEILREYEVFPEDSTVNVPIITIEKTETDENGEEITTVEQTNVLQSGEFIKIERALPVYPDAYVHQIVSDQILHWNADKVNKTASKSVPVEPIIQEIQREALRRIEDVIGDERKQKQSLARAARLNAEVAHKGKVLTVEEKAEVDQLIAVDDYRMNIYADAEKYIAETLPTLTEEQKEIFNAATDVTWTANP